LIHLIDVVGDKGMLGVVQAQQVQVSNDCGLNTIPIDAATMTVRALSIACR
jgi:methionine synthase II (cobalamin-independent)